MDDDDRSKKRKQHHEDGGNEGENGALQNLGEDGLKVLLVAFSKEQLVVLIQEAAQRHTDVLKALRKKADADPTPRTIFVRGLSSDTKSEALRKAFSRFGDVEEAVVVTDRKTQRGRGYGFVTFLHTEAAVRALKEPLQIVEGRHTFSGPAGQGQAQGQGAGVSEQEKVSSDDPSDSKIYVTNVHEDMTAARLHRVFSQYGEISEGPFGFHSSGKSKGYALIVYKTPDGAKRALKDPVKTVDGHRMRCLASDVGSKSAEPPESREGPGASSFPGLSSGISGLSRYGAYAGIEPPPSLPAGMAMNPAYLQLLNNHLMQEFKPENPQNLGLGMGPSPTPGFAASLPPGLGLGASLIPGMGLGASLGQSLSMDPSLAAAFYPSLASVSSNGFPQGFLSAASQGLPSSLGGASSALGPSSLGAHSGGLAGYSAQLAAYTQLPAASSYNALNDLTKQASAYPGTVFPSYPNLQQGATPSEMAQIAGALHSLSSYYNG